MEKEVAYQPHMMVGSVQGGSILGAGRFMTPTLHRSIKAGEVFCAHAQQQGEPHICVPLRVVRDDSYHRSVGRSIIKCLL